MTYGATISRIKKYCGMHAGEVVRITGATHDEISELIFNSGVKVVRNSTLLSYSKAFWAWFKMTWYSHDADYVAEYGRYTTSLRHYANYHAQRLEDTDIERNLIASLKKYSKK